MRIEYTIPIAGKEFRVRWNDIRGEMKARLVLNGRTVKEYRCPDAPCQEVYRLEPRDEGRALQILTVHNDQNRVREYVLNLIVHPPSGQSEPDVMEYKVF